MQVDQFETYKDMIDKALEELLVHVGVQAELKDSALTAKDVGFDAQLILRRGRDAVDYWVKVKPNLTEANAGQLKRELEQAGKSALVITRYVPAYLAKKLRALGLRFVDTAGNAFLDEPPIYIFVYGNKLPELTREKAEKGLFTAAGVKMVFALLCKPELKDATYREIAADAKVALGTVNTVMKRLQRQGYLADLGTHGRRMERRKQLFDRWVIAYAEQLSPKQLLGRFAPKTDVEWGKVTDLDDHALWGGETAAALHTTYLKPYITTIYTRRPIKNIVHRFKLIADPRGTVELREIFWGFEMETTVAQVVPPLLVCADLMATADPRNIQTAMMIYEDHLQAFLK